MNINELIDLVRKVREQLSARMRQRFARKVAFGDLFTDRWETARELGFGEGSSCYDNVLVIGDVKVGRNVWIGPNVVLDGSGGLEIGDYCSISAGVQIYTHHTVEWALTMGAREAEKAPVRIGSGVYIGPQTVIEKGVTVGDRCVIGAMSLVNANVPSGCRAWGVPAQVHPIDG
jgi:acetyltransferase-like isoleucine patch superfamily enzyme